VKGGWQTKKLGDLCEIELGKTPARANKSFWDEKRETSNVWLSIADLLNAEDKIVVNSKEYLSDEGAAISKIVRNGTLLVSFKLTLGRLAFAGRDLFTNEAIAALTIFNERELSKEYLFYFLHFFNWHKAAENDVKLKGMTLNKAKLRELQVYFPLPPEQKRIVTILDEAFEGISAAVANAEKNLANARELFESYLQSVFDTKGEQVPLSELATDITDGDHSPPPKAVSGVPFITISDIVKRTRTINFSNTFFVPQEYFQNLKPNKKPRPGDVLYTVTGATLGIPVLVKQEIDFCFQRHIGLIRPKPETDSVWLSYALLSPQVFWQATVGSTGAAQKTVSLAVLRSITVPKIQASEQRAIAAKLDALTTETQHLESLYQSKLAALAELKQAVLQKAFAGELTAQPEQVLREAVA
jgi:type I restriction enzyme S subunit